MTTQFDPDVKAYDPPLDGNGDGSLGGMNQNSLTNYSKSQSDLEPALRPSAMNQMLSKQSGRTLRGQLLMTVLPTVLVPLAIASTVGYNVIHQDTEAQIKLQLQGQALLAGEAASQLLEDTLAVQEAIATNPLVINAARASTQKAEADKLTELPIPELEKRFEQTKLLQPNQILNDYLIRIAKIEGLTEIAFTEKYGFYIAHTNLTSDFVQNDEEWWQKGKADTQWVNDPEFDESANSFGVEVIQAIRNPDSGEFLGVIEAVLPSSKFDRVAKNLQHTNLYGSQQVQLLDVSTKNAIHTVTVEGTNDVREVMGGNAVLEIAEQLVRTFQDQTLDPEQATSDVKAKYSLQNLTLTRSQVKSGEPILIGSFIYKGKQYTLAPIPQTDWVAVSSMDTGEIAAAGNKLVLIFALGFLVLGAVAIAIVLRLARQLSEPLSNLSDTAEEVAAGNLNVAAQLGGTTETQTLAKTFNNLVTQVRGLLQEQFQEAEQARLFGSITASRARTPEDLEEVFNKAVRGAQQILQVDRVVIYRFYSDWRGYISAESVNPKWPEAFGDKIEDACIGEHLIEAYKKGRVVPTNNVYEANFHPSHLQLMERLKIKANLVTPILKDDQLFGLLIAHHCAAPHVWQQPEIDFLRELAIQVGLSLERVSFLEQVEQARHTAESLAQEQRYQKETLQIQLLELLSDIEGAARGDLTVRAEVTVGEIGTVADFFNSVVESLRSIVTQVKKAAAQVNASLGENEGAIRQLSSDALKQAEETTRTLDSLQTMTLSIQEVAENARQAAAVAHTASTTAVSSGEAMDRTVENIFSLRETVADTAKKVKRLGESSQRISKVASLIEQIAMQTKLLAINAGIEAAIAGEQGQGFAVVAEEVGELAARAATATKEIEKIVESIQQETAEVVEAMEVGTAQVVEGTHLVEDAKESLNQILGVSRQIDALVQSISTATVSQAETSQVVTELMKEIAKVSEHTSNSTRRVSGSLQETVEIAQELQASVGTFKIGTEV